MDEPKKDQYIEKLREEYREDLSFSRFRLDDACESQAELFDKWHQRWVDYIGHLEARKRELGEKRAELDGRLRKGLADNDAEVVEAEFGCYKATEASIAAAVEGHKEMKEIQGRLSRTNLIVNTLRGAVEAFQQRKGMLQQMCELFVTGYYGDVQSVRNREIDEKLARGTKVPETGQGKTRRRKVRRNG